MARYLTAEGVQLTRRKRNPDARRNKKGSN